MQLLRRHFLQLAAGGAAWPALARIARADTYPSRPVRWIVNDPPAGAPDLLARLVGQWMSERLGQSFIVENRPGAGGNIGTEAVVKAPPDGYTLLMITTTMAINATYRETLAFKIPGDIATVGGLARLPLVMVVNPSFPAQTAPEFIAYAKAHPGQLNMASAGNGSGPHLAGELFKMMTGIDMVHVPYRGGPPAMTAVLGGQVQVYFVATSSSIEMIKAGKLRALGVTTAARWEGLPDVPALGEFVPGYEASVWFGVGAPRNTPSAVVDVLNSTMNAALADPNIKARIADMGGAVLAGTPADFGKLVTDETEKWAKVVKFLGIKGD